MNTKHDPVLTIRGERRRASEFDPAASQLQRRSARRLVSILNGVLVLVLLAIGAGLIAYMSWLEAH